MGNRLASLWQRFNHINEMASFSQNLLRLEPISFTWGNAKAFHSLTRNQNNLKVQARRSKALQLWASNLKPQNKSRLDSKPQAPKRCHRKTEKLEHPTTKNKTWNRADLKSLKAKPKHPKPWTSRQHIATIAFSRHQQPKTLNPKAQTLNPETPEP